MSEDEWICSDCGEYNPVEHEYCKMCGHGRYAWYDRLSTFTKVFSLIGGVLFILPLQYLFILPLKYFFKGLIWLLPNKFEKMVTVFLEILVIIPLALVVGSINDSMKEQEEKK